MQADRSTDDLAAAVDAWRAGRPAEAATRARRLVAQNPRAADAWHLLARLALEDGDAAAAESAARQALAASEQPAYLATLARALHLQHRRPEEEQALRRSLALDAAQAGATYALARLLAEDGRLDEAEPLCRRLLGAAVPQQQVLNLLGCIQRDQGRPQQAETSLREAIAADRACAPAWSNLGLVLEDQARMGAALEAHQEAVRLAPGDAGLAQRLQSLRDRLEATEAAARAAVAGEPSGATWAQLGALLRAMGRADEAVDCFRQALALEPERTTAMNDLAGLLAERGDTAEADALFQRACALEPGQVSGPKNYARLLVRQGRRAEAKQWLQRALALAPDDPELMNSLAVELVNEGDTHAAEPLLQRALELRPDYEFARLNLGIARITRGEFVRGWPDYEARRGRSFGERSLDVPSRLAFPEWRGEPLAGKSLLVWREQGFGDEIQMVRYAPLLKALGAREVLVCAQAPLVPLLRTAPGVDRVGDWRGDQPPACDYWVMALSLPMRLGTTLDTIPANLPYLHADTAVIQRWQPRLPPAPRIGLVWKGAAGHGNDANRSLPGIASLAPLWGVAGLHFVSLQKGQAEDEAATPPAGQPLVALGAALADFADAAAVVTQLDLLVTVDTAIAHVAGALGKPVWVLLPAYATDWRWLQDRDDSPWYPGVMRLFRQAPGEGWDAVIARVAQALRELAGARHAAADRAAQLAEAVQAYAQGRLDDAATRCETVVAADPRLADAWHLLARVALDRGQAEAAEAHVRRALAVAEHPAFLGTLARVLHHTGRREDEAAALRRRLQLQPGNPHATYALARNLADRRQFDEAEALCRAMVGTGALQHLVFNLRGRIQRETGRLAEATRSFEEAIAADATYPPAWSNLGLALYDQGRLGQAMQAHQRALELAPADPLFRDRLESLRTRSAAAEQAAREAVAQAPSATTWTKLAALLRALGRTDAAIDAFRRALDFAPQDAAVLNDLAALLGERGALAEATTLFGRAYAADPAMASARKNQATLLVRQGRRAEARACLEQALALAPDDADTLNDLAVELLHEGQAREAEPLLRRALARDPAQEYARLNLGIALITQGDFVQGWPWYEARRGRSFRGNALDIPNYLPYPEWRGEPLAGKSILIWREQGFGDEIQLVRYAPLLKARGAREVVVCAQAPLVELLRSAPGVDRVVAWRGGEPPACDAWTLALSLPMHLGTTVDTIPADLPYLHASVERQARWRPRLPASPRVGLVWKGAAGHGNDANRSLPSLATLAPLWQVAGPQFVSLQKGRGEDEAAAPPAGQPLTAFGPALRDFADTAAVVAQLDLVITVDTAIAHLAGALGRRVWVLLPARGTDWRWLQGREDSPWYPGVMRLFRQGLDEPWDAVVARVAEALRALAATPDFTAIETLLDRAVRAHQQGRRGEAEALYDAVLARDPANAEAWHLKGLVDAQRKQPAQAEAAIRRALALQPNALYLANLAKLLRDETRLAEAEACLREALALEPERAATHATLAKLLHSLGRHAEADAAYQRALQGDPADAGTRCAYGMLLLARGDYARGWPLYEGRMEMAAEVSGRPAPPPLDIPRWQGEPLAGKTLLVWPEQGFGDNIQFIRYAPLLKARGVKLLAWIASPQLAPLLAQAPGVDLLCASGGQLPEADCWTYPLSLPLHLGTTVETIPAPIPYLRPPPDRVPHWRGRLPRAPRVGLVWRGSPTHSNNAHRSIASLRELAPLWEVPRLHFVSLQKGSGEDEARQPPAGQPLLHLGDAVRDFGDSAAVVSLLDLVICVDTAVAHVAGALGKPAWVLLPAVGSDWRWLRERDDSPWYPGVLRLFRQRPGEDWSAVVSRVRNALAARFSPATAPPRSR